MPRHIVGQIVAIGVQNIVGDGIVVHKIVAGRGQPGTQLGMVQLKSGVQYSDYSTGAACNHMRGRQVEQVGCILAGLRWRAGAAPRPTWTTNAFRGIGQKIGFGVEQARIASHPGKQRVNRLPSRCLQQVGSNYALNWLDRGCAIGGIDGVNRRATQRIDLDDHLTIDKRRLCGAAYPHTKAYAGEQHQQNYQYTQNNRKSSHLLLLTI